MKTDKDTTPQIPGYTIKKVLGEGGMATVYLAVQETFERHVALKVLSLHLLRDKSFGQRFLREAKLVANMSHPNIIPVYDVGKVGDYHYIAMEYLPGADLKAKLDCGITIFDGLTTLKEVALGLDYAGKKNLVHRDIKPENILFRESGHPVICDFGIARQTDTNTCMTQIGTIIGTPFYMSPEQAEGVTVDHRADLYSLGVIFYELITGELPFKSDTAVSIAVKHITDNYPPLPQQLAPFDDIMKQALAKNPAERFQSGQEFYNALDLVAQRLIGSRGHTIIMPSQHQKGELGSTPTKLQSQKISRDSGLKEKARNTLNGLNHQVRQTMAAKAGLFVVGLVSVLATSVFLNWYYFDETSKDTASIASDANQAFFSFSEKSNSLVSSGLLAMEQSRLFEPPNDNAHHYLTTALALSPSHAEGIRHTNALFSIYLDKSASALTNSDRKTASLYMNKASELTFYVNDDALTKQYRAIYAKLNLEKQHHLARQERSRLATKEVALAEQAFKKGDLTSPKGNNAYELYQKALFADPDNKLAQEGVKKVSGRLLELAVEHANKDEISIAKAYFSAALDVDDQHVNISRTEQVIAQNVNRKVEQTQQLAQDDLKRVRAQEQLKIKLSEAADSEQKGQLFHPMIGSAFKRYQQVLTLDPTNKIAVKGIQRVKKKALSQVRHSIQENNLAQAEEKLPALAQLEIPKAELKALEQLLIESQTEQKVRTLIDLAHAAMTKEPTETLEGKGPVDYYRSALTYDPQNETALKGINQLASSYLALSHKALLNNAYNEAEGYLKQVVNLDAEFGLTKSVSGQLQEAKKEHRIAGFLTKGHVALLSNRLTNPAETSAYAYFSKVLSLAPNNAMATDGIKKVRGRLLEIAKYHIKQLKLDSARALIAKAEKMPGNLQEIKSLQALVVSEEAKQQEEKSKAALAKLANQNAKKLDEIQALLERQGAHNDFSLLSDRSLYKQFHQLQSVDPSNTRLQTIKTLLLQVTSDQIESLIDQENYLDAHALITEVATVEPKVGQALQTKLYSRQLSRGLGRLGESLVNDTVNLNNLRDAKKLYQEASAWKVDKGLTQDLEKHVTRAYWVLAHQKKEVEKLSLAIELTNEGILFNRDNDELILLKNELVLAKKQKLLEEKQAKQQQREPKLPTLITF